MESIALVGVASVAQVVVVEQATLEPDCRIAGARQQPVHIGLKPASKDVPRVVGSVRQIGIGRTRFAVYLEFEICRFRRVYNGNVEVEEVHLAVLLMIASSADGVPCHSGLMLSFAFPILSWKRHSSAIEPDQIRKCRQYTSCTEQNMSSKFIDNGCFQSDHEDYRLCN